MGVITLPIPISYNGKKFSSVEIKDLTAGVLADTQKMINDPYKSLKTLISGCCVSIGDETDKTSISNLVGYMPYASAEYVATRIILLGEEDDGIEGVYYCPRCGEKISCESNSNPDLDTSDHLNDIPIESTNDDGFKIELVSPVSIEIPNEPSVEVFNFFILYPTLYHCSSANQRFGPGDKIRLQLAIYIEAITHVNGEIVDRKWKSRWGIPVLERLEKKDIRNIGDKISKYGLKKEVRKLCGSCGKDFSVPINTSNFFYSALRSSPI